jgi:hypothetical protein
MKTRASSMWSAPLRFLGGVLVCVACFGVVNTAPEPSPVREAATDVLVALSLALFLSCLLSLPFRPMRLVGGTIRIAAGCLASGIGAISRSGHLPGTSPDFSERHELWSAVAVFAAVAPLLGLIWGWIYMMKRRPVSKPQDVSDKSP